MSRLVIGFASVLLLAGSLARTANAQSSYTPQRPVLSPWLQLEQNNTGPLDNYHTYVLPQMQLNETLRSQNAAIERQQIGLQTLTDQIVSPRTTSAAMVPTGQGATFMSFGHYFPNGRPATLRAKPVLPSRPAVPVGGANLPSF